jgi:thiol reductant ABC exporter CydD subunit
MTDHSNSHKRLFRLAFKHRTPWILLALLSFLSAVSIIILMHGFSVAIDTVFMQGLPLSSTRPILLLIFSAIAIRAMLSWITEIMAQFNASKIKAALRDRLFRHVQQLGPVWAESRSSGELAATAVDGIEKLDAYYARFIPAGIHMAVVPVTIALVVLYIDWISGLILLVTGPLIPVFMSLIGMRAQHQTQKQWTTLRFLSSHFLDAVQGLRTLKLFNHSERKHAEIGKISDRFRVSTMGVLRIAFLSGFVLELFASIATALVAVEIGVRLIEGHIGFQVGLFILLLAPEYYLPFRMFGAQHHAGMEGTESAATVFQILDSKSSLSKQDSQPVEIDMNRAECDPYLLNTQAPSPLSIEIAATDSVEGLIVPGLKLSDDASAALSFHGVTFSYTRNNSPVLTDCTFCLRKGQITALAGLSGSGKTTILRLMTRQLQPDKGEILLEGLPSGKWDDASWLGSMAIANQTSWFFDDTILANIEIARPGASLHDVEAAARSAGIHDFIASLPKGYHTSTGEFATRFSGGERQRLSIARALLRDAPILILDEPSSAMDPQSESRISATLNSLHGKSTVFLIAHRLSTVQKADRILLLDQGRIVASGTHEELLANCNLYQQMVSLTA